MGREHSYLKWGQIMKRYLFFLLVFCALLAADNPKGNPGEDAAAKEITKLQGKWKLVEEDNDGTVMETKQGQVIAFEKEILIGYDGEGGVVTKDSLKLDPTKSPKEIDETIVSSVFLPRWKGWITKGIYELKDDELKMAFPYAPSRERPKAFATKKGSKFGVYTYKRVGP
jgi:uncharacterized protein (TIGR03067 family)